MGKTRILIAGGGIGGLTAALALIQRGFRVSVYEQAPDLHEFGAGIGIMPNGSRVLHALGLHSALEAIASIPQVREMRLFTDSQTWRMPGMDAIARFGSPFWLVHRGDFHRALASAVEEQAPGTIHVGARCVGFQQDAHSVELLLETGVHVSGEVLIGADGVHSRIRRQMFGEGRATFTGFMAWRAAIPMQRVDARFASSFTVWLGPSGQIVTYPMRRGTLLNFAATVERGDWLLESWSQAGTVDECQRDFPGWHSDAGAIIGAIDVPYKWALIGRPPLEQCSVGRVTLLGDAFHPTLPVLGQGANMTLEDGMVLARCLEASDDVTVALQRYERARLERTTHIVENSFENAKRMRNPELADPDRAHAFMDRQFSSSALDARFNWMYEYDATSVVV
jgi:salicylate hydroxylase